MFQFFIYKIQNIGDLRLSSLTMLEIWMDRQMKFKVLTQFVARQKGKNSQTTNNQMHVTYEDLDF